MIWNHTYDKPPKWERPVKATPSARRNCKATKRYADGRQKGGKRK